MKAVVDFPRHGRHETFKNPNRQRHVEKRVRESHGNVCVEQAQSRIELKDRKQKDRRGSHAVGQQPEEQMLVAEEAVARERIRRRQRYHEADDRVDADVGEGIDIAPIPGRIGQYLHVVVDDGVVWKERHAGHDVVVVAQRHVEHPVDRQEQDEQIDEEPDETESQFHRTSPLWARSST
jgi:RNase P protein component